MAQKGLWNLAEESLLRDRGALPREEGDLVREYKAMHEENSPSRRLREDVEGMEERKEMDEEESRSGKREVRERRRKRLLLKESVSIRFPVKIVRSLVPWRCWGILVFLVVALVVALVFRRFVGLWSRLVCLWCLLLR